MSAAMRDPCTSVELTVIFGIVVPGGDAPDPSNISTTSSLVIAQVNPGAKHGNRAASSKSGAADCLEALGVIIDLSPRNV